jgi:hypothetical protein
MLFKETITVYINTHLNLQIQNVLLIVEADGTYSYCLALKN